MTTLAEILDAINKNDLNFLRGLSKDEVNLQDSDGLTILMNAVLSENTNPEVVQLLIEQGADINTSDKNEKYTTLHFAARDQKKSIVSILLKARALVDPIDKFGNTPLWRAVMTATPNVDMIKELIAYGADPSQKNNYGFSPIDIVEDTDNKEILAILKAKA